jgi:hypothetical protein
MTDAPDAQKRALPGFLEMRADLLTTLRQRSSVTGLQRRCSATRPRATLATSTSRASCSTARPTWACVST